MTSASWKASFPSIGLMVWPQRTTIGTESIRAVRRPVTVLVAPGPEVTSTTPGLPVARRVAVRHVGSTLLVAHHDQLDVRVDESVEHGHGGPTGEAEDVLDPLPLETLDELLGAGRRVGGHAGLQETVVGGQSSTRDLRLVRGDRRNIAENESIVHLFGTSCLKLSRFRTRIVRPAGTESRKRRLRGSNPHRSGLAPSKCGLLTVIEVVLSGPRGASEAPQCRAATRRSTG